MSWQMLVLPTARETPGPRGRAGCPTARRQLGRCSCRHEVGLEGFDRHLRCRVGLLAPQFAGTKDYGVKPLRVLAGAERRGVRKDVTAANRLDRPEFAAGVARQAGMRRRMDILGPHRIAWLETGGRCRRALEGPHPTFLYVIKSQLAVQPDAGPQRAAGGKLVLANETMRNDAALQPKKPALVIGGSEIGEWRQIFERGAPAVDRPQAGGAHRPLQRQHPPLPIGMEHRLVGLGFDRAKALHAAHVVDRVRHRAASAWFSSGDFGRPVPTMLSRVTSAASASSLQPSVPAGRIGTTRKRVSAVESQIRTSISDGRVTPKSASTPLGSITVRER